MRRKLPCKHIYRLAIELGCVKEAAKSNSAEIKRPKPQGYSLKDAIAILEGLGNEKLEVLHDVLYTMFYEKKNDCVGVFVTDELSSLINAGVLTPCDDLSSLLGLYSRNELNARLLNAGISGFKKNMKHDALIQWICENVQDAAGLCQDAVVIRLADAFLKPARKIYTYLNRRNRDEHYYDPESGDFVAIPHGSQFRSSISIDLSGGPRDKQSSLVLFFPDDEITELLDFYGVNRCRTWTPPSRE